MSDRFRAWLADELARRKWSHNDLASTAGLSRSAVSNILSGYRNPSVDFCIRIALALGEAPEKVLRLAGILPASEDDPTLAELQDLIQNLPPDQRQEALRYLKFLYQQRRG